MRRAGLWLLLLLGGLLPASARPVPVTLWISGGTQGILTAGRDAPGHLGVLAHIQAHPHPNAFWIDLGGTGDLPGLPAETFPRPDALIPSTELLQTRGITLFTATPAPWTALNTGILPQYPDSHLPLAPTLTLRHPDGPVLTVIGLLPDTTPLLVPPPLLRPLRILPAETALQEQLPHLRASQTFPLVSLPEGSDPSAWSRAFPSLPLLIEPPANPPAVIPVRDGAQLRVRPALHGRALIRVHLTWDTVTQTFSNPSAEIDWVHTPDLSPFPLPPCARSRLLPLTDPPDLPSLRTDYIRRLLRHAEAAHALLPPWPDSPPDHPRVPELWRPHLFPRDFAWIRLEADAETLRLLREHAPPDHTWSSPPAPGSRILLPAPLAAGLGGAALPLRRHLDTLPVPPEPLPLSARDLLFP